MIMSNKERTFEVLEYLKQGGYSIQDLLDAAEEVKEWEECGICINSNRILQELQAETEKVSVSIRIANILQELGVIARVRGYHQLKEAIMIGYLDKEKLERICDGIYAEVGRRMNISWQQVERTIRWAIEKAFDRMPIEVQQKYFKNTVPAGKGKLSNSEFITMIVERLHLEDEA